MAILGTIGGLIARARQKQAFEHAPASHDELMLQHLAGIQTELAKLTAEMKVLRATVAMGNQSTLAAVREGNSVLAAASDDLRRARSRVA